jgi:hypothetical protein
VWPGQGWSLLAMRCSFAAAGAYSLNVALECRPSFFPPRIGQMENYFLRLGYGK